MKILLLYLLSALVLAQPETKWIYKGSSFGATQTPILQTGIDYELRINWGSTTFVREDDQHIVLWMSTDVGGAKIYNGDMVQTYVSFPDPDAPGFS